MNSSAILSTLKQIETDVSDLNRKKILFNAKLAAGTTNYLPRADYSSSPVDFFWQNDKGVPVYIYNYRFIYVESNEPTSSQLYHSNAWSCNIGAMNITGTGYEAPYITIDNNRDNMNHRSTNLTKQVWTSDTNFNYEYHFKEAPIEIGVSRKFGHYIAGNLSTSSYDSDPVGIIQGYYYA